MTLYNPAYWKGLTVGLVRWVGQDTGMVGSNIEKWCREYRVSQNKYQGIFINTTANVEYIS